MSFAEDGLRSKGSEPCETLAQLFDDHRWMVPRLGRLYFCVFAEIRDDLVQEGYLALWNAACQFNARKGRFSSYAAIAVKRAMRGYINSHYAVMCIPENKLRRMYDMERFDRYFSGRYRREPNPSEVARFFDISVSTVGKLKDLRAARRAESLDEPALSEGKMSRVEMISDDWLMPSLDRLEGEKLIARSRKAIAVRVGGDPDRNIEILRMRLGITSSGEGKSLAEIGEVFGVSRERIRQIEQGIYAELRKRAKS
jgi:RNA polymerase primary sigma factor